MKWEHAKSDSENGYHRLSIEVPWSEIAADYQDVVARYAKVRLPGFRPGKVPRAVIEKRFRREIMDDLTQRCAQRLGREAIQETGREALGAVHAETIECEKNKAFRFQVRFQPMPEIALPEFSSLKSDDVVTDAKDRISRRLLDLVRFAVPDELVKGELAFDGIVGGDPESAEWKTAEERVRLLLILKRIARQEGIEMQDADVNNRIVEKAKEFGTSKEELKEELVKRGGLERLRDMLLAERTLDYLMEKTGVSREEESVED
jgi:FKBP-type peptidyl-prolyl cis-trans isomerase (trigger factor)